jgi:serine/threonine protein kinase
MMIIGFDQVFKKYSQQFQKEWLSFTSKPISGFSQKDLIWFMVHHNTYVDKISGWKLHVSAGWQNASTILDAVLPILIEFKATFKFTSSMDFLIKLNSGELGPSQVGKFITIYPRDKRNLVELAKDLHMRTQEFFAPEILTDRRCYQNSIIYYRWGRINPKFYQTPYGAVVSKIVDPQGKVIIDDSSSAFGWFNIKSTPFDDQNGNYLSTKKEIIKEQYLKILLLNKSSAAETYLAVDLLKRRRCILKIASKDSDTDVSHLLASERLAHETAILSTLQKEAFVPRVYDFIDINNKTKCLILEDIEGKPLDSIYRQLDFKMMLQMTKNLTKILMKVHEYGIVHGDIKPSNFIGKAGKIFLIDFNSASDINRGIYVRTAGSSGFASPRRQQAERPTILDDIYSLGAIFYYMFTGLDHEKVFLEGITELIPPHQINPEVPVDLSYVILRCLNRDEKCRIQSADELLQALVELNSVQDIFLSISNELKNDTKDLSNIEQLCTQFVESYYKPDIFGRGFGLNCQGEYEIVDLRGTAGCLLMLLNSYCCELNNFEPIIESCSKFFYELEGIGYNEIIGLYAGSSSIALVLIFAGYLFKDKAYLYKGIDKLISLSRLQSFSFDLINGRAGLLRTILIAYVLTHDTTILKLAHSVAQELILNCYQVNGHYCFWPSLNPSSDPLNPNYLIEHRADYAHGCAGILDVLLDYYVVTKRKNALKIIKHGFNLFISSCRLPRNSQRSQVQFNFGKNILSLSANNWCQAGGGLRFLLRSQQYGIDQLDNSFIDACANSILLEGRKTLPIQCHGIAGNAEILLDIFQFTQQKKYYLMALELFNLMDNWLLCIQKLTIPGSEFLAISWLQGVPGIISAYLRLSNLEDSCHVLSLEYFQKLANANGL